MIEDLINQTIDAAKQEKLAREKEASESVSDTSTSSPVVESLKKLATQLRKEKSLDYTESDKPVVTNTKLAESSSNIVMKGLTLLKRYAEGNYAS